MNYLSVGAASAAGKIIKFFEMRNEYFKESWSKPDRKELSFGRARRVM